MNAFAELLRKGADEAREYCRTSPEAPSCGIEWLQRLAQQMDAAAQVKSPAEVEREIEALAYSICDSGPIGEHFAPSFTQALDALQRLRKRR